MAWIRKKVTQNC